MREMARKASKPIAILVGIVLFLAGMAKATQPTDTLQSLEWALGPSMGIYGLVVLILVELVLGSLLLSTVAVRATLGAAGLLFLAFMIWIVVLEAIDAPVGCGCGVRFGWSRPLLGVDGRMASLWRASGIVLVCFFGFVGACLPPATQEESDTMKAVTV